MCSSFASASIRGNSVLVQMHRHLGVLGSIVARALDLDLLEADLPHALAGHVLEGDRLALEMPGRERVHAVGPVRLEDVGLRAACRARAPAKRMPWFASTCMSYLRFWPTLRCCSLSSQGLSRASTCSRESWSGAPA